MHGRASIQSKRELYSRDLARRHTPPHNPQMPARSLNVPPLPSIIPARGNVGTRTLARAAMRLFGWRFEGTLPALPKFVLIVAPHTSNWDFVIGIMVMFALGIRGTFLGKHTLFWWPLGIVMRWLGGLPVIRSSSQNQVEQTIHHLRSRARVVLALSPEGTRTKLPAWRTGFYYLAKGAGVPNVPVALDFLAKTIRILPPFTPTDDIAADLASLQANFTAEMAYHSEQY